MLNARAPGHLVEWHETIDSTMYAAARRAGAGCPHGLIVGADEQTAGQGRYGRHWHSERDAGLYFSEVLRLNMPAGSLPVITLALGLATAWAITDVCGLICDLRWPNDVLVNGRKCAGILVQLHDNAVVAGIGINVNNAALPDELAQSATSLRLAAGREFSRERLFIRLVESIDEHCETLVREGKEAILRMFSESSSYVRGRRVTVEQGGAILEGTTEGLDASGFLILRRNDGRREMILAGGVRPAT